MDSLNDILSSLTADDIETLKSMADSLFSSGGEKTERSEPKCDSFLSPEMLMKLSSVMNMMNSEGSDRYKLIEALKPNLSSRRRKKADEAMQMMKMLEIIPIIAELNKSGDNNA